MLATTTRQSLDLDDNEAAITWAKSLVTDQDQDQDHAFHEIGRYWFRTEPWAATAWAQEDLGWSEEKCAEVFGPMR